MTPAEAGLARGGRGATTHRDSISEAIQVSRHSRRSTFVPNERCEVCAVAREEQVHFEESVGTWVLLLEEISFVR